MRLSGQDLFNIVMIVNIVMCAAEIIVLRNRVQDLERRLDKTYIRSRGPSKPAPFRQRTISAQKGVARQAELQIRTQRNADPESKSPKKV